MESEIGGAASGEAYTTMNLKSQRVQFTGEIAASVKDASSVPMSKWSDVPRMRDIEMTYEWWHPYLIWVPDSSRPQRHDRSGGCISSFDWASLFQEIFNKNLAKFLRPFLPNRRFCTCVASMANIDTPVPSLKLNDGMSIPMVSFSRISIWDALKPAH